MKCAMCGTEYVSGAMCPSCFGPRDPKQYSYPDHPLPFGDSYWYKREWTEAAIRHVEEKLRFAVEALQFYAKADGLAKSMDAGESARKALEIIEAGEESYIVATCLDCQCGWDVEPDSIKDDEQPICPNCGGSNTIVAEGEEDEG